MLVGLPSGTHQMLKNVWNGGKDHASSGAMQLEMKRDTETKNIWMNFLKIINIYVQKINSILKKKINIEKKRQIIIGEGNHRILITK